jgi:hypothetical protein
VSVLGAGQLIGRRGRVLLRADEVIVYDGRTEAARHQRATRRGARTLLLDHYLEVLTRKPGRVARLDRLGSGPRGRIVHPTPMTRSGRTPARRTGRRAPARWLRCCCCTCTCRPPVQSGFAAALYVDSRSTECHLL